MIHDCLRTLPCPIESSTFPGPPVANHLVYDIAAQGVGNHEHSVRYSFRYAFPSSQLSVLTRGFQLTDISGVRLRRYNIHRYNILRHEARRDETAANWEAQCHAHPHEGWRAIFRVRLHISHHIHIYAHFGTSERSSFHPDCSHPLSDTPLGLQPFIQVLPAM